MGGAVVLAPPATAADLRVHLNGSRPYQLIVDDSRHHLLLLDEGHVSVVTTAGAPVASHAISYPMGLALSPDAAHVYLSVANTVWSLDPQTLAIQSHTTWDCAGSLATAAGKIWVSYGCNRGTLGSIDPATGATATDLTTEDLGTSGLRAGGATLAVPASSGNGEVVFDVTGGSPVLLNHGVDCPQYGLLFQLAVSPDGSQVATTCDTSGLATFTASDPTQQVAYGATSATEPTFSADSGFLAVSGTTATSARRLWVFATSRPATPVLTRSFAGYPDVGSPVFGANGDLFSSVCDYNGTTCDLLVVHQAALHPTTLSLSGPASQVRDTPLTITGSLASATSPLPAGLPVSVARLDLTGTNPLPGVTTATEGSISFPDTPPVGGPVTYRASWPGDATHRAAVGTWVVQVPRVRTTLTVASNSSAYAYNAVATVTAHLGSTYASRVVAIYATPYPGVKTLVRRAAVDSRGNLIGTTRITRRTVLTAEFAGDARTAPLRVARTVVGRGLMTAALLNAYTTSGSYRLFHDTGAYPAIPFRTYPAGSGCAHVRIQQYVSGSWRAEFLSSKCLWVVKGVGFAVLNGDRPRGIRFRVRVEWTGSLATPAMTSRWLYLRFTR